MDWTVLFGIALGVGGILIGNLIEGGHTAALIQGTAALIVFGGTLGAVITSSRRKDLSLSLKMFRECLFPQDEKKYKATFDQIIEFSKLAKKESILALENRLGEVKDRFMTQVLVACIDGIDGKIIRESFERRIQQEEDNLGGAAKVWADAGGFSPTIGIIGAVLGLIHVMSNLTDTSKLGTGIAVAFVATIYGVGSANLIFLPVSNKIKKRIHTKTMYKQMVLEGCLGIQASLNPYIIQTSLGSFIETEGISEQETMANREKVYTQPNKEAESA